MGDDERNITTQADSVTVDEFVREAILRFAQQLHEFANGTASPMRKAVQQPEMSSADERRAEVRRALVAKLRGGR